MPSATTGGPPNPLPANHAGGDTPPAPAPYVERALGGRARLNVKQTAHLLGVHPATLRVEVQRGGIRQIGSGKGAFFAADSILEYYDKWINGAFVKEVLYRVRPQSSVAPGRPPDHPTTKVLSGFRATPKSRRDNARVGDAGPVPTRINA